MTKIELKREVQKGYAAERLRGVRWSSSIAARMSVCHYEHQREFVLESAARVFGSQLFDENLFPLPGWYVSKSRKKRRKVWRQIQRAIWTEPVWAD